MVSSKRGKGLSSMRSVSKECHCSQIRCTVCCVRHHEGLKSQLSAAKSNMSEANAIVSQCYAIKACKASVWTRGCKEAPRNQICVCTPLVMSVSNCCTRAVARTAHCAQDCAWSTVGHSSSQTAPPQRSAASTRPRTIQPAGFKHIRLPPASYGGNPDNPEVQLMVRLTAGPKVRAPGPRPLSPSAEGDHASPGMQLALQRSLKVVERGAPGQSPWARERS